MSCFCNFVQKSSTRCIRVVDSLRRKKVRGNGSEGLSSVPMAPSQFGSLRQENPSAKPARPKIHVSYIAFSAQQLYKQLQQETETKAKTNGFPLNRVKRSAAAFTTQVPANTTQACASERTSGEGSFQDFRGCFGSKSNFRKLRVLATQLLQCHKCC